jgi:hypothetical protein
VRSRDGVLIYYHLIERREAEIRDRERWVEELAARWGLVLRT